MTIPDDAAMLLELLNSTPVEGGVQFDGLRDDEEAAAWTKERGGAGVLGEVVTVRRCRDVLQSVVRGDEKSRMLATFLRGAAMIPSMESGALVWRLQAPKDDVFAARAVLAWNALEQNQPGRLRSCGNPECSLFLIDRSHGNRAQWCSMAVCGNRMKARRHYQRKREASDGVVADVGPSAGFLIE